jgi:methylmalonyl-CoA mutase cobalamin-binding subunit
VERLRLLKQAVCAGRRISDVACLDTAALEHLVSEDHREAPAVDSATTGTRGGNDVQQVFLDRAVEALLELDRHRLHRLLCDASVELSGPEFRHQFIVPLLSTIGVRWQQGSLRIVHEHLASIVVRSFLAAPRNNSDRQRSPRIVVTTPTGQYHELGALMASAVAEEIGWDVYYLGASLPAEEIVAAANQIGARAVALSLCYRESNALVLDELARLRHLLDDAIAVFVGGNAVSPMRDRLVEAGITCPVDLAEFRAELHAAMSS